MKSGQCDSFRRALERALRGAIYDGGYVGRGDTVARELAWHEHLLGCAECQALLRSEEALEELLSSLPVPHLPPDLTRRVLRRLQRERTTPADGLDHLLDTPPLPAAPAGLEARVLRGLRASRATLADRRLDALLDRAPEPEVPPGLSERLLVALESGRRTSARSRFVLLRGGRRWAAAAAIVLTLGAGLAWLRARDHEAKDTIGQVADELLSQLEVLENWDALMSEDLDLYLASLDPVDWTLLELEAESEEEQDEG